MDASANTAGREIFPSFANLLTIGDIAVGFAVTEMTTYNWRRRKERPLPCVVIPGTHRDVIRFQPEAVAAWAKEEGREFHLPARISN